MTSGTKQNKIITKLLIITFLLFLWEIICRVFDTQVYFPSFFVTVKTLSKLVLLEEFWISVLSSLIRVFIGFILAMLLGFVLGIICSYVKLIKDIVSFIMVIIKSTPVVSFIILFLIWIKTDYLPAFTCILMSMPIMYENVIMGISSIDKKLVEVSIVYKINKLSYIKKVIIPSLKPFVFNAIVSSFGIGWKSCIAAEVIARPHFGIGTKLYDSKVYLETPNLFAYTFVVIILSYIFEKTIKTFAKISNWEGGE